MPQSLQSPQPPQSAGYYDTSNIANGLIGPHESSAVARDVAISASVSPEAICLFRWSDRFDAAQQLGIDPPA